MRLVPSAPRLHVLCLRMTQFSTQLNAIRIAPFYLTAQKCTDLKLGLPCLKRLLNLLKRFVAGMERSLLSLHRLRAWFRPGTLPSEGLQSYKQMGPF